MAVNAKIFTAVKEALAHLESGDLDEVKAILTKLIKPAKKHAVSGYNVFIGKKLKGLQGKKVTMKEAMTEACAAWKELTEEEKNVYKEEAKKVNSGSDSSSDDSDPAGKMKKKTRSKTDSKSESSDSEVKKRAPKKKPEPIEEEPEDEPVKKKAPAKKPAPKKPEPELEPETDSEDEEPVKKKAPASKPAPKKPETKTDSEEDEDEDEEDE
jgi:hypothetical protein